MNIDKILVSDFGRIHDRRIRLSESDKKEIIDAWRSGVSIHQLSRDYHISRRTIQFILFPERKERNYELRTQRGGSKIYYDRNKWRAIMRKHREHKRQLAQTTD